ncbi:Uncharacterised protein [Sebaldella termitidis]|uniref:DUF4177 domain-containing protein n=1 Tax=Sebaldella termitidis (strain ATCC 33386 / NCTC 11300) TaxID=526218 RepID=D1AH90_SEBTE|nr:DUF4177 domain-containing protein [Sebaldella termitidis]ACZ08124.1 hypothetical protein Sterm_1257 [Sebaldella termitidis ATCC 33386]SUI23426.1 Uncharacterised protein [Sebaldella termitidis]
MEKFEYQVLEFGKSTFVTLDIKNIQPTLNRLGAEGWEVVSMITINFTDGGTRSIIATLKRKIID